ncbi:DUF5777 family beta-barrel protein [Maribellus maritimus]|uniref:DUF5777 family beta-barrel protein n=1 Tax=Maribellus maritimus TaxID=2870838 RepID=UPI001EEAE361|nr:DUF5777 family beta-barrel protein [Maribellus maritimus]MCG6186244.1 DUF5777 family beta-barrel protein [Maribellus maritimus]
MKHLLTTTILLCILGIGVSYAQEEEESQDNIFKGTRFVNAQSANLVEKGKLNLSIQHRFGDISGGLYELFGLDLATMRLGFEYGFGENFNLGIGRSTYLKTYDGFAKFRFVQQSSDFPFTITATAEGAIPTLKNYFPDSNDDFSDKFSGAVQLHLAKTIQNFGLQISPGYLNTGYLNSENTSYSLFTLGLGGSVKVSKKVSVNLEYLHSFNDDYSNTKPLSLGVDLDTGGHLFQLIVSNSQQMFGQYLYTHTNGDWGDGHVYFGFNLIRQFRIKYY